MSSCSTDHSFCLSRIFCQSYQWLKEKIVSEDGRKQQAKLKELNHIAEKLGCTLPQLAVGKAEWHILLKERLRLHLDSNVNLQKISSKCMFSS